MRTSLLTEVVAPTLSVTTGSGAPPGGVIPSCSAGTGNPPLTPPGTAVWKLMVASPAGRCSRAEPGMGTSP